MAHHQPRSEADLPNFSDYILEHDITGLRFGTWTVLYRNGWGYWECRCECCGRRRSINASLLREGRYKPCRGLRVIRRLPCHSSDQSRAQQRIYKTWQNMMRRCYMKSNLSYRHYGGRGITVCERWHVFKNFFSDMGYKEEGMTIERVNNNGPYSPENCIWATAAVQCRNKRNNVRLTYNGETLCITDWAKRYEVNASTIRSRMKRGWAVDEVLFGK